MAHSC